MQPFRSVRSWTVLATLSIFALVFSAQKASAQKTWYATAGAETRDESVQADGFFPNEVWITAGDSIEWTFAPKNEIHTVTFLAPNQVRPSAPPPVGPPAGTPVVGLPIACGPYATSATYTGANCVSSNPVADGATFKVTFPNAGNYKLVCLVHTDMNGVVHVLTNSAPNPDLLQNQRFYDDQGRAEASNLLGEDDDRDGRWQQEQEEDLIPLAPGNQVVAGTGHIVGTGAGTEYRAVVRFLNPVIRIHKGESVTWTNIDPTEPHTVTFGTEPPGPPTTAAGLGTPLPDGTLTAMVNCPNTAACDADFVQEGTSGAAFVPSAYINSGFLQAAAPDRTAPGAGVPPSGDTQVAPGTTRITISFPVPGDYFYHCALHDVDGMYGEVVVLP